MVQLSYITVHYRKTLVEFISVGKQWKIYPQLRKHPDFGLVTVMNYHLSVIFGGNIIPTIKI